MTEQNMQHDQDVLKVNAALHDSEADAAFDRILARLADAEARCLPELPGGWIISRMEEINSVSYGNYWFCCLRQISIYPKFKEVGSHEYSEDENKPTTPRAAVLEAIEKVKESANC